MIRNLVIFAVFAASVPGSASAQVADARELNIGVPIRGTPSAKPVPDLYFLVGESGAKETYTLSAKGLASITLFGPDGSEILASSGSETVKLEAVLPFTDVFTIAVSRLTSTQPYVLRRAATVPTFQEAYLAYGTGYQTADKNSEKCWTIPGARMRILYPKGTEELTLLADRHSISLVAKSPKGTRSADVVMTYDGTQVHRVAKFHDGTTQNVKFDFDPRFTSRPRGAYSSYLCNP